MGGTEGTSTNDSAVSKDECPRLDCLTLTDPAVRAHWEALNPVQRQAITLAWCVNPRIVDGAGCVEAVAWYTINRRVQEGPPKRKGAAVKKRPAV
jgi:hypothetical protein